MTLNYLRCLFLATEKNETWIVPYAAISEVVYLDEKLRQDLNLDLNNSPNNVNTVSNNKNENLILGQIQWRNKCIPVISLASLDAFKTGLDEKVAEKNNKSQETEDKSTHLNTTSMHVAIFNRISKEIPLEFMGILLKKLPIMRRIRKNDLSPGEKPGRPHLLMEVFYKEERAYIPNILSIETECGEQLQHYPKSPQST